MDIWGKTLGAQKNDKEILAIFLLFSVRAGTASRLCAMRTAPLTPRGRGIYARLSEIFAQICR